MPTATGKKEESQNDAMDFRHFGRIGHILPRLKVLSGNFANGVFF
jgi:hypothetical protein